MTTRTISSEEWNKYLEENSRYYICHDADAVPPLNKYYCVKDDASDEVMFYFKKHNLSFDKVAKIINELEKNNE